MCQVTQEKLDLMLKEIQEIREKLEQVELKMNKVDNYLFEEDYNGDKNRASRLDQLLMGVQGAKVLIWLAGIVGVLTTAWAQFKGWF